MTVGLVSFGSANPGAFTGNPNVTITAINTSGGIVTSRDSDGSTYQIPFFIQVSASAITATGTSAPYEDLSYSWNFGDPSGTETFIRPTDGGLANANTDQRSPEAVYCYRTAGTKVITLNIRGKNGGGYTTASVTKTIVVSAFGGTDIYADQNGVGSGQTGAIGNPWTTIAQINTAIAAGNVALHLKRGSNWTGGAGININPSSTVSNFRIDAYGSGADPIVNMTTASSNGLCPFSIYTASANVNDVVVSNVDFIVSSASAGVGAGSIGIQSGTPTVKNVYFDNVDFSVTADQTVDRAVFGAPYTPGAGNAGDLYQAGFNFGWWKCSFTNPLNSTHISMGLGGSAQVYNFIVGGSVSGAGTNNTYDHHFYIEVQNHSLVKWVDFGQTGTGAGKRSFCINGNYDGIRGDNTSHLIAQYHCYSENEMQYTDYGYDLGNAVNNLASIPDSTVQFQYAVAEGNAFNGVIVGSLFGCGLSVTQRDNRGWGSSRGDWYSPVGAGQVVSVAQATHLLSKTYRNKIYVPSSADVYPVINFPDSGWTVPQYITDNIIVDARASGVVIRIVSSDHVSAGSVINRNQYWSTTGDTTFLFDGATGKTFSGGSSWQTLGWDANGSNADPGWPAVVSQWSHMN